MIGDLAGPDFFRYSSVLDQESQHVARIYATALQRSAEKKGQGDTVLDELAAIVGDLFVKEPEIERFLSSAAVRPADKDAAIRKAFAGKVTDVLLDFLL